MTLASAGGDDDFGLEIGGAVKDLGGESAPASGARKMAATPAPIPAAIKMRRSDGPQPQEIAEERAETRPDLGDRPFAATRTAACRWSMRWR